MSEFLFGVHRGKLPAREVARRDQICREHGGYGYTQIDDSHGTAEGGRWFGWFSGPNRGAPFDERLSAAVLAELQGRHQPGTWYLAPATDPADEHAAGYDGNTFATREEAEDAIDELRRCGEDFAATEWVAVQRGGGQ